MTSHLFRLVIGKLSGRHLHHLIFKLSMYMIFYLPDYALRKRPEYSMNLQTERDDIQITEIMKKREKSTTYCHLLE